MTRRQDLAQRVAEKLKPIPPQTLIWLNDVKEGPYAGTFTQELWNHLLDLEEEVERLRTRLDTAHSVANGEVWYWQGDGEDHLESLTCPILITPAKLRSELEEKKS